MTNWEKLCGQVNLLINKQVDEDLFHSLFEQYLKTIFNWDEGSIKSEVPVKIGTATKYADIVLYGNDFGIVIEMKRPGVALGDEERKQLFSYMRILGYKYGLLIGSEFQILFDNNGKLLPIASFAFDANNAGAEEFCEILDKNVCSKEKLFEWVKKTYKAESGGGGGTEKPLNSNKITEFKEKCVIIKVHQETVDKYGLYEAVRQSWRARKEKAERADYVIAVVNKIVRGVFKPEYWYRTTNNRIAFIGVEADDNIKKAYLNKQIPDEYIPSQNPIQYNFV